MIGNFTKRCIWTLNRFGHAIRLVPFQWDAKEKTFRVQVVGTRVPSIGNGQQLSVDLLGFKVISAFILGNWAFGGFRILQSVSGSWVQGRDLVFQFFIFLVSSLSACLQVNHLYFRHEVAELFTAFFQNEEYLTRVYQRNQVRDTTVPLVLLIGTGAILEVPALVILYLTNSASPVYIGSLRTLFPPCYDLPIMYVCIAFELLMATCLVANALLHAFLFIAVMTSISFWLKEMRPIASDSSNEKLRTPEILLTTFKSFQVLMNIFNSGLAKAAVTGQHAVTSLLLILCTFTTIRYYDAKNFETLTGTISYSVFPLAFVIFSIWIGIVHPRAAALVANSENIFKLWRKESFGEHFEGGRKFRMYLESCRTINTDVGSFFHYRVITTPRLLNNVANHTVTLLITFK